MKWIAGVVLLVASTVGFVSTPASADPNSYSHNICGAACHAGALAPVDHFKFALWILYPNTVPLAVSMQEVCRSQFNEITSTLQARDSSIQGVFYVADDDVPACGSSSGGMRHYGMRFGCRERAALVLRSPILNSQQMMTASMRSEALLALTDSGWAGYRIGVARPT